MRLPPEYEEMVVAELEAQFAEPPPPRPDPGRLLLIVSCLLGGTVLLLAADHGGLRIRISDLLGFSTASVGSALGLAGHALLLGCAFLVGLVVSDRRRHHAEAVPQAPASKASTTSGRV